MAGRACRRGPCRQRGCMSGPFGRRVAGTDARAWVPLRMLRASTREGGGGSCNVFLLLWIAGGCTFGAVQCGPEVAAAR